jgi:hypothetical protein
MEGELLPLVIETEKDVSVLVKYDFLKSSESFLKFYDNPNLFISEAKELLLTEKNVTIDQKVIIVMGMQKLEKKEYFFLLREMINGYEKGRIQEKVLKLMMLPPSEWNMLIYKNYDDKEEVELFNIIKNNRSISEEFRESIDDVLSGDELFKLRKIHIFKWLEKNLFTYFIIIAVSLCIFLYLSIYFSLKKKNEKDNKVKDSSPKTNP